MTMLITYKRMWIFFPFQSKMAQIDPFSCLWSYQQLAANNPALRLFTTKIFQINNLYSVTNRLTVKGKPVHANKKSIAVSLKPNNKQSLKMYVDKCSRLTI